MIPIIDGICYEMLIDTGATCSSLSMKFYNGPVSAACITSVGIDGIPMKCPKTHSLTVQSPDDHKLRFDHKFTIIPNCPFNLLGRELMYRLGCCLTFGEDGFTIETPINSFEANLNTLHSLVRYIKPKHEMDLLKETFQVFAAEQQTTEHADTLDKQTFTICFYLFF